MPAIVEAEDLGLYVLKFRGAGQGPLALVAEWIAGEIGRAVGLQVPEIVFVEIDEALGRNEPDQEIRDLLRASIGLNLAMDYLPGSLMFDPAVPGRIPADLASLAVWFDAFVTNVDRTPRNPNLLCWHKRLYFIDHGAALYFHHDWQDLEQKARSPFAAIKHHVLLPWASEIAAAGEAARAKLNAGVLESIVAAVPEAWLGVATREGYLNYFLRRLEAADIFTGEALRARAQLL